MRFTVGYHEGDRLLYPADASRLHPGDAAAAIQGLQGASDTRLPVREAAGEEERPHDEEDARLPLARADAGRAVRVPGMD
jgi:hypothetical protein